MDFLGEMHISAMSSRPEKRKMLAVTSYSRRTFALDSLSFPYIHTFHLDIFYATMSNTVQFFFVGICSRIDYIQMFLYIQAAYS